MKCQVYEGSRLERRNIWYRHAQCYIFVLRLRVTACYPIKDLHKNLPASESPKRCVQSWRFVVASRYFFDCLEDDLIRVTSHRWLSSYGHCNNCQAIVQLCGLLDLVEGFLVQRCSQHSIVGSLVYRVHPCCITSHEARVWYFRHCSCKEFIVQSQEQLALSLLKHLNMLVELMLLGLHTRMWCLALWSGTLKRTNCTPVILPFHQIDFALQSWC